MHNLTEVVLDEKLSDLRHREVMIDEQVANSECSLALHIEVHRICWKIKIGDQDAESFPISVSHTFGRYWRPWSFSLGTFEKWIYAHRRYP
jgi:hypothetical protein